MYILYTWEVVANTIEKCSIHIGAEREIISFLYIIYYIFYGRFRGKARYQHGLSALFVASS